jgi:amino acid transporter
LLGNWGVYVAWVLSLCALFSTFNAGIMGGSRLIYALTREGNLPQWCGIMSLRSGAPTGGIILLGGCAIISSVLVVCFELELLAAVIGSTIVSFIYPAFMLAVIRLRKTHAGRRRSFRTNVPPSVQWVLIITMPLMGLATLFAQGGVLYQPAVGTLICLAISICMACWSLARTDKAQAGRTAL